MENPPRQSEDISLSDFAKYLVFVLHKSNIDLALGNEELWHVLFYRLKKVIHPEKPVFIETLWFDWGGRYPKSPELADVLHAFCWTGLVNVISPQYNEYRLGCGMDALQQGFEELNMPTKSFLQFSAVLFQSLAKSQFFDDSEVMAMDDRRKLEKKVFPHECGFCEVGFSTVDALYAHQQEKHDPDGIMFSELGFPK